MSTTLQSDIEILQLGPADIDAIVALERSAFIPPLQADRSTIALRLERGHTMLGVRDEGDLVAMVAFSYARFDPEDRDAFPRTFREYSTRPVPDDYNTVFFYNLEVECSRRGRRCAESLAKAAMARAGRDGCLHGVADGRMPSYAGSTDYAQESIPENAVFRAAVDRYRASGQFPTTDDFLRDPVLAFYYRLSRCRFLWIMPDFLPEDEASGGMRVILYLPMAAWKSAPTPKG